MPSRAIRALCLPIVLLACGPVLTGCGNKATDDGTFQAGTAAYPLSCLNHQPNVPGNAYTAGEHGDTAAVLEMLKYYTGNRDVPRYCDGAGPTPRDRAWAQLYVTLGAQPANVAHVLAP